MGTILFTFGFALLAILLCIGTAFLIHIIIDSDLIIVKILAVLLPIIIAVALIIIGLKLGVNGIGINL